jgi:hypothetical protein
MARTRSSIRQLVFQPLLAGVIALDVNWARAMAP